jgi:hypothetical protein
LSRAVHTRRTTSARRAEMHQISRTTKSTFLLHEEVSFQQVSFHVSHVCSLPVVVAMPDRNPSQPSAIFDSQVYIVPPPTSSLKIYSTYIPRNRHANHSPPSLTWWLHCLPQHGTRTPTQSPHAHIQPVVQTGVLCNQNIPRKHSKCHNPTCRFHSAGISHQI